MALRVPLRLGRTTLADVATSKTKNYGDSLCLESKICRICVRTTARYTCPRCRVYYCSLSCYRQHNTECTEMFARDHVVKEIETGQGGLQSEKIIEKMKECQEEQFRWNDAFCDGDISLERLEELALMLEDNVDVYNELSDKERKQFHDAIDSGILGQFIRPWEPWWSLNKEVYIKETLVKRKNLISEMNDSDNIPADADLEDAIGNIDLELSANKFPAVIFREVDEKVLPANMKDIIQGAKKPSVNLKYHLLDMLAAYCTTMRQYNGDWLQSPANAAEALFSRCETLMNSKMRFSCIDQVLNLYCASQNTAINDEQRATFLMRDVSQILSMKTFVLDALSDLGGMIRTGAEELVGGCDDGNLSSSMKKAKARLHAAGKKVAFYLCWGYHTSEKEFWNLNQQLVSHMSNLSEI